MVIYFLIWRGNGYFQFIKENLLLRIHWRMSQSWIEDSEVRRLKAECERLGGVVKVLEKGI